MAPCSSQIVVDRIYLSKCQIAESLTINFWINRSEKERRYFFLLFFIFYLTLLVSVVIIEAYLIPGVFSLEFFIAVLIVGIGFFIMLRGAEKLDRFAMTDDDDYIE